MCGRYTLRMLDQIATAMSAIPDPTFEQFAVRPRYNIAPSQAVAVVRLNADGGRALSAVKWGLVPSWAKEPPKVRPINACAETVRPSGMFRQAFARRRCLIPADGFFEWRKLDAKTKQPMFMHLPGDRPFAFAGLWERWKERPDDDPLDTCTIITTTPNALMADIHDRMPVILSPDDYGRWLDRETDPAAAAELLRPYPDGELVADRVDRVVNSPKHDGPECVAPLA